ncbi:MAG: RhuM family protein, partial [Hyphomicrobium sp.]
MARKPTLADATQALEEAARVATTGTRAERSGQVALRDTSEMTAEEGLMEGSTDDRFLIFQGKAGVRVELEFSGETMWATQRQMAELFDVTPQSITIHLRKIFAEGELDEPAVCKQNLHTAGDGKRYMTRFYNLDAIISVGYRVNSKQGTLFRRWATDKLVQFAVKGFALDDERLKQSGGNTYFTELRERIRDIRASEANTYAELKGVCALCSDYDPNAQQARNFFMGMQNKLLFAVTSHTAPEIISSRADASAPNMGLSTWSGQDVTKADATVAKNYLAEAEIRELN